MASQKTTKALRLALKQVKPVRVQQRAFQSVVTASRTSFAQKAPVAAFAQQSRGLKTVDFAGSKEDVYGRHWHKYKTLARRKC